MGEKVFLSFSAVSACVHLCERSSSKLSLLISSVIWCPQYFNSEQKYVKKRKREKKNVCSCILKLNLAQVRCSTENAAVLGTWESVGIIYLFAFFGM